MDSLECIRKRHSIRAFLDSPVSREQITELLEAARWAPSGVNSQPWHVAVLQGNSIAKLSNAIIEARHNGVQPNPEYRYYPDEWVEPYKQRRKENGLALYKALDIGREDTDARIEAWNNNYRFFRAPVGLLVFMDRRMGQGSWLDIGMFMQNIMLAATARGLATCPQAALADYPDIVYQTLNIESQWKLLAGISLGYADADAAVNSYTVPRQEVDDFTDWHN